MNLSQIYEGWRNKLIPPAAIKDIIQETSDDRMNVCNACPHHSKNHKGVRPDAHCTYCGCTLSAKTKCLSCKCPIDKWLPVLTEEQEQEIKSDGGEQQEEGSDS